MSKFAAAKVVTLNLCSNSIQPRIDCDCDKGLSFSSDTCLHSSSESFSAVAVSPVSGINPPQQIRRSFGPRALDESFKAFDPEHLSGARGCENQVDLLALQRRRMGAARKKR